MFDQQFAEMADLERGLLLLELLVTFELGGHLLRLAAPLFCEQPPPAAIEPTFPAFEFLRPVQCGVSIGPELAICVEPVLVVQRLLDVLEPFGGERGEGAVRPLCDQRAVEA